MDARSIKQKTTNHQSRLLVVLAVFVMTLLASVAIGTPKPASAATRPCQAQYNAVAKVRNTPKEATAEKVLNACIVKHEAQDWCDKKILKALNAASRKPSMDRCKNWFKGGFMNPPNPKNPEAGSPAVFLEAKNAGTALRGKYRADASSSNNSGGNSSGSSSPTPTGSAGPSGSTGSAGPSGSTTSPSGPSGTTPSGGTGSTGNAPKIDTPSLDTVEENRKDPALECTTEGADDDCDLVQKYLNPIIAFLSAFVGIAVVIGIISGGIRYASASDDPQKSAAGRQMVRNSLVALVAYIFLYAALKWLIPQ